MDDLLRARRRDLDCVLEVNGHPAHTLVFDRDERHLLVNGPVAMFIVALSAICGCEVM